MDMEKDGVGIKADVCNGPLPTCFATKYTNDWMMDNEILERGFWGGAPPYPPQMQTTRTHLERELAASPPGHITPVRQRTGVGDGRSASAPRGDDFRCFCSGNGRCSLEARSPEVHDGGWLLSVVGREWAMVAGRSLARMQPCAMLCPYKRRGTTPRCGYAWYVAQNAPQSQIESVIYWLFMASIPAIHRWPCPRSANRP